jgi:hypothetical protein
MRLWAFLSGVALLGAAAQAQEVRETQTPMMLMSETFDGAVTRSLSQKAGVAEARRGDDLWVNIDFGDGAVVERRNATLSAGAFRNLGGVEAVFGWTAQDRRASGNARIAHFFNTVVRPLASPSGQATTQVQAFRISPALLGLREKGATTFGLAITRRNVTLAGRDYTWMEYEAPAFSYANPAGETVVHWAHGGTLYDAATAQAVWSASAQRAVSKPTENEGRAYRYVRTVMMVTPLGKPMIDLSQIPELRSRVAKLTSGEATAPLPVAKEESTRTDQTPLRLAAVLDALALALGEGGAGGLSATTASFVLGETGINQLQTDGLPTAPAAPNTNGR